MKNWQESVRKAIEINLFTLMEHANDCWRQALYQDCLKVRLRP